MALAGYRLSRHDEAAAKGPQRPVCVRGHSPAAVELPASFPVAKGLVVARSYRSRGAHVTEGYALGSLRAVRDFYARNLPARGFRLGAGDAEQYEAETDFYRGTTRGHLKLNVYPSCPGAVAVAVVTRLAHS